VSTLHVIGVPLDEEETRTDGHHGDAEQNSSTETTREVHPTAGSQRKLNESQFTNVTSFAFSAFVNSERRTDRNFLFLLPVLPLLRDARPTSDRVFHFRFAAYGTVA